MRRSLLYPSGFQKNVQCAAPPFIRIFIYIVVLYIILCARPYNILHIILYLYYIIFILVRISEYEPGVIRILCARRIYAMAARRLIGHITRGVCVCKCVRSRCYYGKKNKNKKLCPKRIRMRREMKK